MWDVWDFKTHSKQFYEILGRPYKNKFGNLGHYPVFTNDSYCKGCDRLIINGYEWKIISTIDFLIVVNN